MRILNIRNGHQTLRQKQEFLKVNTLSLGEEKLKHFIETHHIQAEHLSFEHSCHSVAEAAETAGTEPENFVKNICMTDAQGSVIVAIVKGEDRASTTRVAKALGVAQVRTMAPEEVTAKTGYPCGGTPSFGFAAQFLIDPRVLEKQFVYTGGGSETSLVCLSPHLLLQANGGKVVRIRK
jgi:Cys-tRNA(Pro)/Cys-tRNA(Cys) deacylase